ncbi:YceD family protein [Parasphingorhabdus halotolerans]|uniref:DUF177 domain-containing protein n=1 Tax=Parasphingorhabdus halotolerans TaxID=2725558 RepID=A0A6H2DRR7_9SPHN|nr:YceD family protein [Parasphingorhabdus halotolerans]QJB70451.1 DUF177 domain-containing protein [Parasphingorhabdus halotolerans]
MSDLAPPELSRIVKLSDLGEAPVNGEIIANADECTKLANRFDLPKVSSLVAEYELVSDGEKIKAYGLLKVQLTQFCAISGQPFPVNIREEFQIAFVKKQAEALTPEAEIELASEDCDVMEFQNAQIDIGEAVAQSLYLALDPYPRGPDAEKIAKQQGLKSEEEAGPFGALSALKDKLG